MTPLALAARFLREKRQMTQRAAAEALGVSFVHVSNVERGRAVPSPTLIERYRDVFGADPHVLGWCLFVEDDQIPQAVRGPRKTLAEAWRRELNLPPAPDACDVSSGGTTGLNADDLSEQEGTSTPGLS